MFKCVMLRMTQPNMTQKVVSCLKFDLRDDTDFFWVSTSGIGKIFRERFGAIGKIGMFGGLFLLLDLVSQNLQQNLFQKCIRKNLRI